MAWSEYPNLVLQVRDLRREAVDVFRQVVVPGREKGPTGEHTASQSKFGDTKSCTPHRFAIFAIHPEPLIDSVAKGLPRYAGRADEVTEALRERRPRVRVVARAADHHVSRRRGRK